MGQPLSVQVVLNVGAELLGIQLSHLMALNEAQGNPLNLKEAARQLAEGVADSAGITDPAAVDRIAQAAADRATTPRPVVQCNACPERFEQ